MTNAKYGRLIAGAIGAWLILSVAASALDVFQSGPGRPPVAVGLAALIPIVGFLLWFTTSAGLRQFTRSLNPRTLTLAQAWRINGFVFLILAAYGILPRIFAWPAGWGDIAIGATAPLVALKLARPDHQKSFILWQVLGMADLVMAVGLGTTAGLLQPQGPAMDAMAALPLSLVPTFFVPLLTILHIICIAQARQWPERCRSRVGEQFAASQP